MHPTSARHPDPASRRVQRRCSVALLAVAVWIAGAAPAGAQSLGALAAWDALVTSPFGALPSAGGRPSETVGAGTEVALQYGRWRYDVDDAIHNDIGLSVSRAVGARPVRISTTIAMLSLSCGDCASWLSAGVELRSDLLRRTLYGAAPDGVGGAVEVRASVGGARYNGDGHAKTGSLAVSLPLRLSVPGYRDSRMTFIMQPGMGVGRVWSADNDAYGTLPVMGGSVLWSVASGATLGVSAQRVVLSGAPAQVGVALTWSRP